jgi:hypothetical protein
MAATAKIEEGLMTSDVGSDLPSFPEEVKLVDFDAVPSWPIYTVLSWHLLLIHLKQLSLSNYSNLSF